MARPERLGLLIALLVAGVAYAVARPFFAGSPYVTIFEYPAAIVATLLVLRHLRARRRAQKTPEPPPLRKHRQIVRDNPDPEAQRIRAPLAHWLERGDAASRAASALARALAGPDEALDEAARRIETRLLSAGRSRRSREAALRDLITPPRKGDTP